MADDGQRQDDRQWLKRLREGEGEAFAEFVRRYQGSVFLCCRSLGLNDTEAEDAASETFLAAYRGLRRYDGRAKLSTWLWRIAYRQAVNYLRRKGRTNELTGGFEGSIADEKERGPLEMIGEQEKTEIVWEAVGRLPKLWSIALVLFYREGKSIAEIGKIMRARKNTVKTYLHRGREKLRDKLSRIFGEDFNES